MGMGLSKPVTIVNRSRKPGGIARQAAVKIMEKSISFKLLENGKVRVSIVQREDLDERLRSIFKSKTEVSIF